MDRSPEKVDNTISKLTVALFIIYFIALFWILLFKLGVQFSYMSERSVNLVPFSEAMSNGRIDFGEVMLNVIIFVPLGIYAGLLFRKWNVGTKVLLFFLTSLTFEVIQYILRVGAFDSTDIITNSFGGIIGLMIFMLIDRSFNNIHKAQKFINFIALSGTVLMIILLLLLKLNMLPIRYQ